MPIVPVDRDSTPRDGFAAEQRAIFAYGLVPGDRDWRGDPLAIESRYEEAVADFDLVALNQHLERTNFNQRLNGQRRLVPVIRIAFGLPPFAEGTGLGLTVRDSFALLERFFAYQDRLRAMYRRDAELLATYGPLPGRAHAYEREVGLWWNRERARGIAAAAHWQGALAAGSFCELPFALVDALAPNEAAARRLAEKLNNDRRQAEAEHRKGSRPGAA